MELRYHVQWPTWALAFSYLHFFGSILEAGRLKDFELGQKGGEKLTFKLTDEFVVVRIRMNWKQAIEYCSKCIGSMAVFENPEESVKVRKAIYNYSVVTDDYIVGKLSHEWGLERRYWIGMADNRWKNGTKETEGKWYWYRKENGTGVPVKDVTKYQWKPTQPDHVQRQHSPEHCVGYWNPHHHMDENKRYNKTDGRQELHSLNDMPCKHQYYFICKDTRDPENIAAQSYDCNPAEASPPDDSDTAEIGADGKPKADGADAGDGGSRKRKRGYSSRRRHKTKRRIKLNEFPQHTWRKKRSVIFISN